METKQNKKKHY